MSKAVLTSVVPRFKFTLSPFWIKLFTPLWIPSCGADLCTSRAFLVRDRFWNVKQGLNFWVGPPHSEFFLERFAFPELYRMSPDVLGFKGLDSLYKYIFGKLSWIQTYMCAKRSAGSVSFITGTTEPTYTYLWTDLNLHFAFWNYWPLVSFRRCEVHFGIHLLVGISFWVSHFCNPYLNQFRVKFVSERKLRLYKTFTRCSKINIYCRWKWKYQFISWVNTFQYKHS